MMSMSLRTIRWGRLIWTVLVTFYFLVFFRNFMVDAARPGGMLLPLVFAYVFVLWLAVEYFVGSPFFQSGVAEASPFWRGVFAFFVYPFLGYVAGDYFWWGWTQIPIPSVITWILGIGLFGLGVYLRLASLFAVVRLGNGAGGKAGQGRFPEKRFVQLRLQQLCRHPRYLATMMQLVGAALVFRSWGGLVLAIAVGLPLVWVQVRHEDRGLRQVLKKEYKEYADRVPLLWPRLSRQR